MRKNVPVTICSSRNLWGIHSIQQIRILIVLSAVAEIYRGFTVTQQSEMIAETSAVAEIYGGFTAL